MACHGAPAITLGSLPWDYGTYTWHTTRDTFDKASLDDVKRNATLTAMLAYLASEDPQRVSRERRPLAPGERWPPCVRAMRRGSEYFP